MDTSTWIFIFAAILFGWILYKQFAPVKGLNQLQETDFRKQIESFKNIQLIDVREPHEFKTGHIRGAVNVPLSQLTSRVGEIIVDEPVYIYCQSGMRSKQAAHLLLKRGYPEIHHLIGGISAWKGKRVA
ncbi:putative adenylyltransferase/sulfurtransferase MoeZ [compost metagenome]